MKKIPAWRPQSPAKKKGKHFHEQETDSASGSSCVFCCASLSARESGDSIGSISSKELSAVVQQLQSRYQVCAECKPGLADFWAQCEGGLEAQPGVFDLLVAAALNRTQNLVDGSEFEAELQVGTKTVEIDGEIVQVPYFNSRTTDTLVYCPLSTQKRNCHLCFYHDKRWQHLRKVTLDHDCCSQIALAKKIFAWSFGTNHYPTVRVKDDELAVLRIILSSTTRSTLQSAKMLWQYLSDGVEQHNYEK